MAMSNLISLWYDTYLWMALLPVIRVLELSDVDIPSILV